MKQYFAVGTYTEPILFGTGELFQGKGTGLAICEFEDGAIRILKEIELQNPSFFCIDEERKKIYAVNEQKEYQGKPGGGITQLSYDESGNMTVERTYNTGGADPCHIAAAPGKEFLSVANFAGGSVAVFPLDNSGNILGNGQLFQHQGHGAHPIRQKGPHAHSVIFCPDGIHMMVPDLGLDEVVMYRYTGCTFKSDTSANYQAPPGSGPRFGEFDRTGHHFYLINELSSQVMHCRYADGMLICRDAVSTLPDGYREDNICSDLHLTPDGRFLYASNRGHDSLAYFQVNQDGSLRPAGCVGCGGKTPRNFAADPSGKYLLVGNQDSDDITVFRIGKEGRPVQVNQMPFGSPVCIRFFKNRAEAQ